MRKTGWSIRRVHAAAAEYAEQTGCAWAELVVRALVMGRSLRGAAEQADVPWRTAYDLSRTDPAFNVLVDAAMGVAQQLERQRERRGRAA